MFHGTDTHKQKRSHTRKLFALLLWVSCWAVMTELGLLEETGWRRGKGAHIGSTPPRDMVVTKHNKALPGFLHSVYPSISSRTVFLCIIRPLPRSPLQIPSHLTPSVPTQSWHSLWSLQSFLLWASCLLRKQTCLLNQIFIPSCPFLCSFVHENLEKKLVNSDTIYCSYNDHFFKKYLGQSTIKTKCIMGFDKINIQVKR